MKKLSKESIITTYTDLVRKMNGRILGETVFMRETGFSSYYWNGGYWRSWSSFQTDAGHKLNVLTQKIEDDTILRRLAELALEKNIIPREPD